jgi:hypothetical protein
MSNGKIADALGVDGEDVYFDDPTKRVAVVTAKSGDDESDDYVLSRSTLRSITELGANALSELLTVAKSSQKARDYEVAAKLMDTLAGLSKTMKDLHKKEQTNGRVSNLDNEQNGQPINIEKAVFVGTTAQLLSELKKAKVLAPDMMPVVIEEEKN